MALMTGHPGLALLALMTTSVDALDGMVARKFHKVTKFGGVLDSSIDRVADFLFLWAFAAAKLVRLELIIPLIICAYLISYLRSRGGLAVGDDKKLVVGLIERTERMVFIGVIAGAIWLFPHGTIMSFSVAEWVALLLLILSAITVGQRFAKVAELTQGK